MNQLLLLLFLIEREKNLAADLLVLVSHVMDGASNAKQQMDSGRWLDIIDRNQFATDLHVIKDLFCHLHSQLMPGRAWRTPFKKI